MRNILLFILLFIYNLNISILATDHLDRDYADKVYKDLSMQWEFVNYKQPVGFKTIFQELDQQFWPALPESYEWRITRDKNVHLYKHKYAPDHKFEFVTYATESLSKFSFLSRWDGVTYHSFAYTRPNSPLSSYDDARKIFPISEFRYNNQTYMRGHCIDYLDTYGLSDISKVGSGTVIESISTLDPRNLIPEPRNPSPYWGETIRKNLVDQIRTEGGCYSQYMYYGLNPTRTDDETATAIPLSIYFVKPKTEQSPVTTSYHVSWSHEFTAQASNNWQACLQGLQAPQNFTPSPFVFDEKKKRSEIPTNELPLDYQLPVGELSAEEYHKVVTAADHEVHNVMGKIVLIQYLLNHNYDSIRIQIWLKRLIEHAISIHQNGGSNFMNNPAVMTLIEKLDKAPAVDKNKTFVAYLTWLRNNDKEPFKQRDITTFQRLTPLKINSSPTASPSKIIDVGTGSLENVANKVINHLHKEPKVHLINITTKRADQIASRIKADFPDHSNRKKISIEYSPKKGATQTKGIRPAFTNVGITPTKFEPQQCSSPTKVLFPVALTLPAIPQKNLKSLFDATHLLSTALNVKIIQKLQYLWPQNQTLYEYFTCPTAEDGNCFFHAAFTEPGESLITVQEKAANLRIQFCDAIQQGLYIDDLRDMVYEHYLGLLVDTAMHSNVPEKFQQYMRDKDRYTSMYNDLQHFKMLTSDFSEPETQFPIEQAKALIAPDDIKEFIEQFRFVGSYESYIPFRPEGTCPANILANLGRKKINIFTFNNVERKLHLQKTVGSEGNAINILHNNNHYIRLFLPLEGNNSLQQSEQIWKNYQSHSN